MYGLLRSACRSISFIAITLQAIEPKAGHLLLVQSNVKLVY